VLKQVLEVIASFRF